MFTTSCSWNAGTTQKWFNMASLQLSPVPQGPSGKTLVPHYPPASHSNLHWSLLSRKARAGGPVLAEAASVGKHTAPVTHSPEELPTPCTQTNTDMHTHPPHPHMYNNKWVHTPSPIHTHTNTPIQTHTNTHTHTHTELTSSHEEPQCMITVRVPVRFLISLCRIAGKVP